MPSPQKNPPPTPLGLVETLDLYFLDTRARLLDIAAFLDRVDRAAKAAGRDPNNDFRYRALREALDRVASDEPGRAEAAQRIFSDPTTEPLESAAGMKGAVGAYPGVR